MANKHLFRVTLGYFIVAMTDRQLWEALVLIEDNFEYDLAQRFVASTCKGRSRSPLGEIWMFGADVSFSAPSGLRMFIEFYH